jgi:HAD superfamily hydrolase (TIGR01549 family)
MIRTVLMDYDGTLHDWDSTLISSLDGILGLSGEDFYRIYVYDVHRALVHTRYMDKHDDMMFHCELIFQHLGKPFDPEVAEFICRKFDDASEKAMADPIYFPDAIPALKKIREMNVKLCLSTGRNAEAKAETMTRITGTRFFDHVFSEPAVGYLKTEPEYYRIVLERTDSEPKETISIGDTPLSDIRPAKMVGLRTIWLNRSGEPAPSVEDQKADHEVNDLLDAVCLLDG